MQTTIPKRRVYEELSRLGTEILAQRIQPLLQLQDTGKFIAIAVDHEDYEISEDDHKAVSTLLVRHPDAEIWLTRVGERGAYRIGKIR